MYGETPNTEISGNSSVIWINADYLMHKEDLYICTVKHYFKKQFEYA